MDYKKYITNVEDFPIPGIQFKDITSLIDNGPAFKQAIDDLKAFALSLGATKVVGPDARGFIFGAPVAYAMEAGFVPVRKPGKLPRETLQYDYDLEYGKNTLCIHKDAISAKDKVIIIDDLLATGGTVEATVKLVESAGGEVVGLGFVIELKELKGRDKLKGLPIKTLIAY